MTSAKVTIKDPQGLHARPAGAIFKAALGCTSSTVMIYGDRRIDLKNILEIMSGGLKAGTEIELQCTGEKEKEDLDCLLRVFEMDINAKW